MNIFLEIFLLKLSKLKTESLKRPITAGEIEAVIKKLPTHKIPGPESFIGEFYKSFKGELTPILHRLYQKSSKEKFYLGIFRSLDALKAKCPKTR